MDREGNIEPAAKGRRPFAQRPAVSSDGSRLAITIRSSFEDFDIWIYELEREVWTRLTLAGDIVGDPLWSPDGKWFVYSSDQTGYSKIYRIRADGAGDPEQLTSGEGYGDWPVSFSPDGKVLAFFRQMAPAQWDILMLSMEGEDRTPQPFLATPDSETWPAFSPDGAWIAHSSNESGRAEIYVRPYPGPGAKIQVSSEGGYTPQWNPNGRELFYRSGQAIWAVPVETEPKFSVGRPKPLFEAEFLAGVWGSAFEVSPDGQRFLLVKFPKETQEPLRLVYVPDWIEELKQILSGES